MATKKHAEINDNGNEIPKPKTCFIIMPIADHQNYEPGHFNRVYEYLIKPACIQAGYQPVRADDSKASHMIMFDILKKIMECDMAICDLSSKNANVFYELGLRQAFNKKTILITDGREKPPFDIAGFRYVPYSPSLRVDSVKLEVELINEMLRETESAPEDDVNSIVKLLKIKPAHIEQVQLNHNESVIFNMFSELQDKIENLTLIQSRKYLNQYTNPNAKKSYNLLNNLLHPSGVSKEESLYDLNVNNSPKAYTRNYIFDGKYLGKLIEISGGDYIFLSPSGRRTTISGGADIEKMIFVDNNS